MYFLSSIHRTLKTTLTSPPK